MGRTFSNYYNYDEELYRNSKAYGSNRKEIEKLSDNLKDAIKNDLTPRQMELVNLYYFQNMIPFYDIQFYKVYNLDQILNLHF